MRFGALQIRIPREEFLGLCATPYRERHHRSPRLSLHRAKLMVLLGIDRSNSEQLSGLLRRRTDCLNSQGLAEFIRSAPLDAQRPRTATGRKDEMVSNAPPHRPHRIVDLSDRGQIASSCTDLGCTEPQLREAVRIVGTDRMFVQQWVKWLRLI